VKGEYPDGRKVSAQGTLPYKVQYLESPTAKSFAKHPTEWLTGIPTVYNADTLGIRPDLLHRPIEHWSELLNPEFKGKSAIVDVPSIGIMDAAMASEATGKLQYVDKGNMTTAEIDKTIAIKVGTRNAERIFAGRDTLTETEDRVISESRCYECCRSDKDQK